MKPPNNNVSENNSLNNGSGSNNRGSSNNTNLAYLDSSCIRNVSGNG